MAECDISFLVRNMYTVEGRMNALSIADASGIYIPDSLAVEILGAEKYDSKDKGLISDLINDKSMITLDHLCRSGIIPRKCFSRAFVRKNDFRNAAAVFQYGRDFTSDAISLEGEGDLFMAMIRYEQAGNFGDAAIISGMLGNNPSRTRAYNMLDESNEKYIMHLHWRDME